MPSCKTGRPPYPAELLLLIHFLQQWFGLSDPAMEEALYDVPLSRQFAGLDLGNRGVPDESTLLRFLHLLEEHKLAAWMLLVINTTLAAQGLMLKTGSVVDATLIDAPSSTKNKDGKRDPEMHQVKKGNQWHFGFTKVRYRGLMKSTAQLICLVQSADGPQTADGSHRI